jgi:hypothetical protein
LFVLEVCFTMNMPPLTVHMPEPTSMTRRRGSTGLGRLTERIFDNGLLTYNSLLRLRRRGAVNGNWRRLNSNQQSLFRCALWVAKIRGHISNEKLMTQVLRVAITLLKNLRTRIISVGRGRAQSILANERILGWAPELKSWLTDSSYVWYLGVLEMNHS